MSDFRMRLKKETSATHDRVDAGFSALDISDRDGYLTFLKAQYLGHIFIKTSLADGYSFPALKDRIEAIGHDLVILGCDIGALKLLSTTKSVIKREYHPLGLTYVIAGSLHGTNVLRKLWERSTDDTVSQANHFMNFSDLNPEWKKVLSALKNTRFSADSETQIIRSVNYAFGLFETAFSVAQNKDAST